MKKYSFGNLKIDPTKNPAVINTLTWDLSEATTQIANSTFCCDGNGINASGQIIVENNSKSIKEGRNFVTAKLSDGQRVILAEGRNSNLFGEKPFTETKFENGETLEVYPITDKNLFTYVSIIKPKKGPKAMGAVPRLGIGVRQSACLWPGIYSAMNRGDFSANSIQNSVRELNLLDTLKSGQTPRTNYLFSFGEVPEGHAGSTFEGLWTYGVYEALTSEFYPRYGADADHLQVKRGVEGIERTKKFIDAAKYYTFYTLDVSDILNYQALWTTSASASASYLETLIPDTATRRDVLYYHIQKKIIGKTVYKLDEAQIGRFVGKYWNALNHVEELERYIISMKNGVPFDLELSIDENPPEVKTFDSITSNAELLFLMDEIRRRNMHITHIAPNFGVEKCTDYRGYDGLESLAARVSAQVHMANEYGFMLDCHSGDDLSQNTRRIFGKAAKGRLHFKVSPSLQQLYSRVLSEVHPDKFNEWYNQTLDYTKECAEKGSSFAINSLKMHEVYETKTPDPNHFFFQEYNFALVGKRDENGQFINREKFYDVSEYFQSELNSRLDKFLCTIADDIFNN